LQKAGVKTIRGDLCQRQDGAYNLLFMSKVYHGLRMVCKDAVLTNFVRMAKQYVAIMNFKEGIFFGPPFKVRQEEVIGDTKKHGFMLVRSNDLKFHYIILFKKEPSA